jgi:hypothetical protein
MALPEVFCWTRFGTEAGQSVEHIFARKEQERIANAGLFFWGIGNAIGPSMIELLRRTDSPEALFSPIQSAARREDAIPSTVVAWTQAQTLLGEEYRLPEQSLVTSRFYLVKPRAKHYALVCYSKSPIEVRVGSEEIHFTGLRNLLTSRPVGASQVTAVVQMSASEPYKAGASYGVAFRAHLTPPYLVSLRTPVALTVSGDEHSWAEIVRQTWNCRKQASLQRS